MTSRRSREPYDGNGVSPEPAAAGPSYRWDREPTSGYGDSPYWPEDPGEQGWSPDAEWPPRNSAPYRSNGHSRPASNGERRRPATEEPWPLYDGPPAPAAP